MRHALGLIALSPATRRRRPCPHTDPGDGPNPDRAGQLRQRCGRDPGQ